MIEVKVSGFEELQKRLKALPAAVGAAGVAAAASYLIGVLVNKEVPPYKYITRAQVPWKSLKQQRYVMMMIKRGWIDVPYKRAGRSSDFGTGGQVSGTGVQGSWELDIDKTTRMASITNKKSYAHWLYGRDQSKRHDLIGWKRMTEILMTYKPNILKAFDRGVAAALKKLRLKS